MALVITKLANNQVEVTGGAHPYTLLGSYEVNLAPDIDGVRIVREGRMKDSFIQSEITQVVRQDGTIVAISTAQILYDELSVFFFFEVGSSGGGGGTLVTTSYVESILVADWVLDGGGRYYVDAIHNLNTKDLLIEAYNIATNDTEVLDDYERTSITTVRIWSTVNTGEYEVLISDGGAAYLMPESTVTETNDITFLNTNGAYFGKFATARTGTLTFDVTDAVTGAISVVYYDNATLDIPVTPIFTSGTFAAGVVNKLYFERDVDNNYTLNILN